MGHRVGEEQLDVGDFLINVVIKGIKGDEYDRIESEVAVKKKLKMMVEFAEVLLTIAVLHNCEGAKD